MANWSNLHFFDKNGKAYNFLYDSTADKWTGEIYLPAVSVGLFEVGQLFILEKLFDENSKTPQFGFPHAKATEANTAQTPCPWDVEWETTDPTEILLFLFNLNFDTGTQSALVQEDDGPPLQKLDSLSVPLDYDSSQTFLTDGLLSTKKITSKAVQLNFAIRSESEENTFKRTLLIKDKCTDSVLGEFVIYGETIGEDERLRVMTNNMGYNVLESDSSVFRNTDIKELLPNFTEVNLKRKEIMMEGSNIYPFIGSYKGLANAIKFFGYNTLQVKEFWRNVDANSPQFGKYIQSNNIALFDPSVKLNDRQITLPNKKYRKTSLFSLVYRINQIVPNTFDEDDLPVTKETFDFTIEEILIKLFGLKRKLEREFLPLNARIKDITGEADFFGLLEVTNTVSKNFKREVEVGRDVNFKMNTDRCILMQDLRTFLGFCFQEEAIVNEAIINFCNAYIAPLNASNSISRNLLIGPISNPPKFPCPPYGPDINDPAGAPGDGFNVPLLSIADVFLAFFSRYAPNITKIGRPPAGKSSLYLPDKPGIPVGAMTTLENTTFQQYTWDDIKSTWDQIDAGNNFYTFDLDPQGVQPGDIFKIHDPVSNTTATYTVQVGDTDLNVVDGLLSQLQTFQSNKVDPWLHWDVSKENTTTGFVVRVFGQNVFRLQLSVQSNFGSQFLLNQQSGVILYTWNSIANGDFNEIEWTIFKPETDISPSYFVTRKGPLSQYNKLPILLPYVGEYTVEMKLIDLYNNISSKVKTDFICVENSEVEYSGWYQSRKESYSWSSEGKYVWNDYGAYWNLPIPPKVTWDEESPSLYESLDRVNAILNNFGLGTAPDFQLLNFQDDGKASFGGPYFWNNLFTKASTWNNGYHLWWDMTDTTGNSPAFFQFKEVPENTYLKIVDKKGNVGEFYIGPVTGTPVPSLKDVATELNLSCDPVLSKYIYNVVLDASNNEKFIQAVSRYYGEFGDFQSVDIVDVNGDRVCPSTGNLPTGATGGTGCPSIIYRSGQSRSSNPTYNTAKFVNDGKVLPPMTWLMFVYDKCLIPGKAKPRWTIRNTSDLNGTDIYFESKYLTYLFKTPGKYRITLELTDTNGNKYKKGRNILVIK
mgnify:CR=1 FL=1